MFIAGAVSFSDKDAALFFRTVHLPLKTTKEFTLQGDQGLLHHLLSAAVPIALHIKKPTVSLHYVAFLPDGRHVYVIVEEPNKVSQGTKLDAAFLHAPNSRANVKIMDVAPGYGYSPFVTGVDLGQWSVALHQYGCKRNDVARNAARLARSTLAISVAFWRLGRAVLFPLPAHVGSPAGYTSGPTAGLAPTAISKVLMRLLEDSVL